jgi:exodeoxyribonuclease VII small subunit
MTKKEMTYSKAVEEIESILGELERGEMEVDVLSEKVKRVAGLIKFCRERLVSTEEAVNRILEDEMPESGA